MQSKSYRKVGFAVLGALAVALIALQWWPSERPADSAARAAAPAATQAPAPKLEPYSCGTVERLHVWNGIFAGSQPSADDLRHASENGIRTIFNLRPTSEDAGFDEAARVAELGMEYELLPFDSPATLTDDVFDAARRVLRDEAKRPLFLHCNSGNRVGAIWAAFRALDGGLPWEAALAEAKEVGLKSPTLEQRAHEYVTQAQGRTAH